jgi:taurine--2-oxoglutarate transaminase
MESLQAERDVVLHSWCVQSDWDAPTVVGGRGARLLLEDGREVLDMSSLAECANLGHQHPRLVEAIRRQAGELCFVTSSWGARPRAELATRLLELGGFEGGRVFFTLSGADANENAVRIARLAAGRPRGAIVTRERSYHGATELGMALSGDSRCRPFGPPAQYGVLRVPPPYAYRCPFGTGSPEACAARAVGAVAEAIDTAGPDGVAAVMMEPNAGTNGIVAPDAYWPALREVTRARGTWLVADEVMSGFGRCGEWFAWQRHGEGGRPDLMTLAKGLTGSAIPLAAVVIGEDVARRVEGQMLNTGLTYCGHPLACAAGVAALDTYRDEKLIERSRRLGAAMYQTLGRMASHHAVIGDVRGGHGLFAVVELVADRATREPLAPWPQQPPALARLLRAAMEQGISFAARGNLLILAPPLVIDEAGLDEALSLLDRLLGRFFPPSPEATP